MFLPYPQEFLDKLYSQKVRNLHAKIQLLNFQEEELGEIQGKVIEGSISVDGSSAIRRTLNLIMILDEETKLVDYAKKIKVEIGIENNIQYKEVNYEIKYVGNLQLTRNSSVPNPLMTYNGVGNNLISSNIFISVPTAITTQSPLGIEEEISIIGTKIYSTTKKEINYKNFGDIIWFPVGVFVISNSSIQKDIQNKSITITAQDKMCLLTGELGGTIQAPARLDVDGNNKKILLYDLIKYIVGGLGEENINKIIIKDVPFTYKQPVKYVGKENKYYDNDGNEVPQGSPNIARTLRPGDYAGYKLIDFVYFPELSVAAGDTVYNVLNKIVEFLGDYEFFYDVNGNFVFQRKPTFTSQTYLPLDEQTYTADFTKSPLIYSFKNKDFIISYVNNLDFKNIKNDFVVWGKATDDSVLHYHLVIDNKPFLPPNYEKPWQQYLVEYGAGPYYAELSSKLPQIYDATTNKWKGEFSDFNYWFDMIDAKSEMGKFSVSAIGRRTKVVADDNIVCLYPVEIPDWILLPQGVDISIIQDLQQQGLKYMIIEEQEYNYYFKENNVGKDAFTVIRELLYYNTNFQDSITLNTIPIYHLEPNCRIEVENAETNIKGHYIIESFSIPLNAEGLMSINASKVYDRI